MLVCKVDKLGLQGFAIENHSCTFIGGITFGVPHYLTEAVVNEIAIHDSVP
ncbi:hypothetical protein D3C79_1094710 [compost metagenome]